MNNASKWSGIGTALGIVIGATTGQWWLLGVTIAVGVSIGVSLDRAKKD